jgi:hypothetical protein
MDRSRGLAIAGAALTALTLTPLASCNPFVRPYRRDPEVDIHRDGATMASQWNATLAAPAGRSDAAPLSGAVAATPALDGTSTYVHVSLASAPPGASYPWQLREGACGGSGALVGSADAYRALAVNDQGRAATSATVPLHLAPGARYHVRVVASAADPSNVVACGELTPPTR